MIEADRLVSADSSGFEEAADRAIRPKLLAERRPAAGAFADGDLYPCGEAARRRLDHLLILARRWETTAISSPRNGVTCVPPPARCWRRRAISPRCSPTSNRTMFCLSMRSIASPVVEEVLYPAMEDYQLDIMIGEVPRRVPSRRSAAVYPDRRHHPRRFVDLALRDRWHRAASGVLSDPDLHIVSRSARHGAGDERRGRAGSSPPFTRHAAYCQPSAAPGA